MANKNHLKILGNGAIAWNEWREANPSIIPDLSQAHLSLANLDDINFEDTNLQGAYLYHAFLSRAWLRRANLTHANLLGANLYEAKLDNANLNSSELMYSQMKRAYLRGTTFVGANLAGTVISDCIFNQTDFSHATIGNTTFSNVDLGRAIGLEKIRHLGPSTIGLDTLYDSAGEIPLDFLRGCGVPDEFIDYIPSHFGKKQAVEFYSCFISYSHNDEDFARRLHSRLRDSHIRVWFAPEDMKAGSKIFEQIDEAIHLYDRLLIVLSESSMQSEWVITEIRNARKKEIKENRRKLFPIRLVDFEGLRDWKCFDSDTGKDLAIEIREYYIPDFSNWKDHDSFEITFEKLLKDLKAGMNS